MATVSVGVFVAWIAVVFGAVSEQIDGNIGVTGVIDCATGNNGSTLHLNPVLKKFIKLAKLTWILLDFIITSIGPEFPQ